jgi:hypothetical protein
MTLRASCNQDAVNQAIIGNSKKAFRVSNVVSTAVTCWN